MSMNVRDGFSLGKIKSFVAVKERTTLISEQLLVFAKEEFARLIVTEATDTLDIVTVSDGQFGMTDRTIEVNPLMLALRTIDDSLERARDVQSFSPFDVGVSIGITTTIDGRVIGKVFTGNSAIKRRFFTIDGVDAYDYSDDMPRPDGVKPSAWSKRRADWNEVLVENATFLESMMSTVVIHPYAFLNPSLADLSNVVLDFDGRVSRTAAEYLALELMREHKFPTAMHLSAYTTNNPEYDTRLAETKLLISPKLKQHLTITDLQEKI